MQSNRVIMFNFSISKRPVHLVDITYNFFSPVLRLLFSAITSSHIAESASLVNVVPVGFCGVHKQISAAFSMLAAISSAVGIKLFSGVVCITQCLPLCRLV